MFLDSAFARAYSICVSRTGFWTRHSVVRYIFLGILLSGCTDLNPPLPPGIQDPESLKNPVGAISLYNGAVALFEQGNSVADYGALTEVLLSSGLLSDELHAAAFGGPPLSYSPGATIPGSFAEDARVLPERCDSTELRFKCVRLTSYQLLQNVRALAGQANQYLRVYAPDEPTNRRAHLYILTAYSEIFLAELYCSGVPLSTVDFEGDFAYHPGASSNDVFRHAMVLLDSADVLSNSDSELRNLIRVARGRALLNIGLYDSAALAVNGVPTEFAYQTMIPNLKSLIEQDKFTVANREGGNGLPFREGDPRTAVDPAGKNSFGVSLFFPRKYNTTESFVRVTLASGIEARLVEAEAALRRNDGASMISILQNLRRLQGNAPPAEDLQDPGSDHLDARVDSLFKERAMWLFFTGHRLGDLRRLVRQYGRDQQIVFPTGVYGAYHSVYGTYVNYPIPQAEFLNPSYKGCLSRGA